MNDQLRQKISKIDWSARKTSYGNAAHIPQALADLTSPDAARRDRAYWSIDNYVVLQSDLYEAAADVAPLLVELLRENPPFGREEIYDLLFELANGHAADDNARVIVNGEPSQLRLACRTAVREGLEIYQVDQDHPNPRVSATARDLIEVLAEDD